MVCLCWVWSGPLLAGDSSGGSVSSRHTVFGPVARQLGAAGTYFTNTDNERNALDDVADDDMGGANPPCVFDVDSYHPIEFDIDMTGALPTSSVLLLIEAYDIDETAGEIDFVYLNGNLQGALTGVDNGWTTTIFSVPLAHVVSGRNLVQIIVDEQPPGTNGAWCVNVGSGQLVIDGGGAAEATCWSIWTDQAVYAFGDTVSVSVEVDTTATSQAVEVEANLLDPSAVIAAGAAQTAIIIGAADDAFTFPLVLPGAGASGTYTAEAIVFDDSSGVFQDTCSTTFVVDVTAEVEIPTLGTAGLVAMGLLLALAGVAVRRRGRRTSAG